MVDLVEIFDKDPTTLTKEDRAIMITAYRQQRAQFVLGGKPGAAKPKAEKEPKVPKGTVNIDIDSLTFD